MCKDEEIVKTLQNWARSRHPRKRHTSLPNSFLPSPLLHSFSLSLLTYFHPFNNNLLSTCSMPYNVAKCLIQRYTNRIAQRLFFKVLPNKQYRARRKEGGLFHINATNTKCLLCIRYWEQRTHREQR